LIIFLRDIEENKSECLFLLKHSVYSKWLNRGLYDYAEIWYDCAL